MLVQEDRDDNFTNKQQLLCNNEILAKYKNILLILLIYNLKNTYSHWQPNYEKTVQMQKDYLQVYDVMCIHFNENHVTMKKHHMHI